MGVKLYCIFRVDYLKYDHCYSDVGEAAVYIYFHMYKALKKTKRPIYYSLCNWGIDEPWKWGGSIANSWRTTYDIEDSWKSMTEILDSQNGLEVFAGKGGWNDPDMLEIGNGGMTVNEYEVHFVMWAILKAPLILGCNVSSLSERLLDIVSNEEVIAVNQDELGVQAKRFKKKIGSEGTTEVWGGPLSGYRYVIVFLNLGED